MSRNAVIGSSWQMSTIVNQPAQPDPGHFTLEDDGVLVAHPGSDLGLLWNTTPLPADFRLELEWRLSAPDDNSGVFVRFPDPESKGYDNTAWVAIDYGFEIQINEPGVPDGAPWHTTGAVYAEQAQSFERVIANPPGEWNQFTIEVRGATYTVDLNGSRVTTFENPNPTRGAPSTAAAPTYFGVQTHTGNVAYRNIRVTPI